MTDTPKRPPGRPKGIPRTTKYPEASTTKTHRLTPTLHRYIKANRDKLERMVHGLPPVDS